MNKKTILKTVREASGILNIAPPTVCYFAGDLSATNYFALASDGKSIRVDPRVLKGELSDFDVTFSIFHECRHAFQLRHLTAEWENNLKNYIKTDGKNLKEYNSQPVELDAHAWTTWAMKKYLGITPLFNGFDDDLRLLIYNKAKEFQAE